MAGFEPTTPALETIILPIKTTSPPHLIIILKIKKKSNNNIKNKNKNNINFLNTKIHNNK